MNMHEGEFLQQNILVNYRFFAQHNSFSAITVEDNSLVPLQQHCYCILNYKYFEMQWLNKKQNKKSSMRFCIHILVCFGVKMLSTLGFETEPVCFFCKPEYQTLKRPLSVDQKCFSYMCAPFSGSSVLGSPRVSLCFHHLDV